MRTKYLVMASLAASLAACVPDDDGARADAGAPTDSSIPVDADPGTSLDFSPVDAVVMAHLDAFGGGVVLSVLRADGAVHRRGYGTFEDSVEQRMLIASATKWISAAVLMTQVEAGRLSLDDTLGLRVPAFGDEPDKRDITLRQAFSHTAGMPGLLSATHPEHGRIDYLRDPRISLEESADRIAITPLVASALPMGSTLHYGGCSMQAVGRAVELAAGEPFEDVFRRTIADPLGMSATHYDAYGEPVPTRNPHIGGGITSTVADIERFTRMLLRRGELDGVRVLSPESIAAMEADQTAGATIGSSPYDFPGNADATIGGSRYGIGVWRIQTDLDPEVQLVAQGATGYAFVVNRDLDYALVLAVQGEYRAMMPGFIELLDAVGRVMQGE